MSTVAVFDFLSHEHMHHPFNEGYLRMLRAAFPDDQVVCHARERHLDRLAAAFGPADGIAFRPCPAFAPRWGLSRHNPLAGRAAAWECWQAMRRALAENAPGAPPRLVAVLGFEANLLAVLRRMWPRVSPAAAPLHLILHNHLAEAMRWRSRNPVLRAFDLIAGLRRPLPAALRVVVLELGIDAAVARALPATAPSLRVLEHPVLDSEWGPPPAPGDGVLRIGFLGHASRDKGFALFAAMARRCAGPGVQFHAIGLAGRDIAGLDLGGLTRAPSPRPVPRPEYVQAMGGLDAVCLPLGEGYDYVASGSVIDAIAAGKPLLCLRNNSLSAIAAAYGEIGHLADGAEALAGYVGELTAANFAARAAPWHANIARLRAARRPQALAAGYAAMTGEG